MTQPVSLPKPAADPQDGGARAVPFNAPSVVGDELECIADAIRRGQLSGDGHYTERCQRWLEDRTGAGKALLTHSCTAALEMAAMLCGLEPEDEVVMPSFTFVSTANAAVMRGAVPVFADIGDDTLNLCPERTAAAITPRTKAIFVVHYAGVVADMAAFRALADAHGLVLVEDAAQALGSTWRGAQAGSLGDLGAFSFHETKNVISGEGGALTINDPALEARAEIIREKGTNRSQFFRGQVDKYRWVDCGSSYLPGELIAAFLWAQLDRESAILARRLALWARYDEMLRPLSAHLPIRCPDTGGEGAHNAHMYYLRLPDLAARQRFIAAMKRQGITAPFHYVPLHSAPAGRRFGRAAGPMEVTDRVADTLVRLPLFYGLEDQDRVIDAVRWALDECLA